jgi:hypothetical protein
MEKPSPNNVIKINETVYLVESGRRIREVQVRSRSGGLYTVRFTDTVGGIRVRGDRLCLTRDEAAARVRQQKTREQLIRPSYWHNVPIWEC